MWLPSPMGGCPPKFATDWTRLLARHRIRGAIISTEPMAHKPYLEFALGRGLSVLVDKPLTTRADVAHELVQARGLWDDYRDTLALYKQAQAQRPTCLLVNSHRRYHPGFQLAFELIAEISERFGCPVTGFSLEHCDGQWRLPSEIITQDYHPYNRGYGKLSHSGYHVLDMATCFLKAGWRSGKTPDTLALTSSFVLPQGFLHQLCRDDYRRSFGAAYDEACPATDEELCARMGGFGEIDATALLELRLGRDVISQGTITLQHNGFSRRTWVRPSMDLYKGNGRVRHERHRIVSGPLQTLCIESYQANDRHDRSGPKDFERGGNNHFEIVVFRNCGMTGDREPMQVHRLANLPETSGFDAGRLYNEQIKEAALVEFLRFLRGEVGLDQLNSNIEDHALTVRLMSALYEAHVLRRQSGGWVEVPCHL